MYTSYSTLQRKQLTKQVYTDTQSTYLLVYAPGRHQALEHALENQLLGHSVHFCQDNESMSSYGVMRGFSVP